MYHHETEAVNDGAENFEPTARRDAGFLLLARSLAEHPVVGFGLDGEPYSRSEAWIDLLGLAAYKPHAKTIRGATYDVARGDVVASERFLASRWHWTRKKVRCFVTLLRAQSMLIWGPQRGQSVRVLKILNYNAYQINSDGNIETGAQSRGLVESETGAQRRKKESSRERNRKGSTPPAGVETPTEPLLPWVSDYDRLHGVTPQLATTEPVTPVKPPAKPQASARSEIDAALAVWASLAQDHGLRPCKSVSSARREKLKSRLKDIGGVEVFEKVLREEIPRSRFLRGKSKAREGGVPFVAHLDFVLQVSSWDKLADGAYADTPDSARPTAPVAITPDQWAEHARTYQASMAEANADAKRQVQAKSQAMLDKLKPIPHVPNPGDRR